MTAAEIPSASVTAASGDARRARIGAAIGRVDVIQISPDVGRLLVHWLGQHAEWATQRYGCAPDGLDAVAYALAEACAADSHGASVEPIAPLEVSQWTGVAAAAAALGVKETTIRWHFKRGSLTGRKVGTALMIDTNSLAEFRANRERNVQ